MIIENEVVSDSLLVGDVVSSDYKLSTCSKMFDILSNHIYTNKIMAPIREIICNAWDSHVAAGNTDKRILVTVPTHNTPIFKVRDYGTGLTETEMRELYTTYGASNKMTSNEFIGCLGLGSKSPFAYTDSFDVVSYKDGRAYAFHCMRTSTGQPTITQFPSVETTEPDGLEVSFDVEFSDIGEFRSSVATFYSTFCTDIDFVYSDGGALTLPRKDLTDPYGFAVVPDKSGTASYNSAVHVVMGGVAYTYTIPYSMPAGVCEAGITSAEYRKIYSSCNSNTFYILADIGDITVAVSREQCENTPENQRYIITKLHAFFDGVVQKFTEELDSQSLTQLQRADKIADFYRSHSFIHDSKLLEGIITLRDPDTIPAAEDEKLEMDKWRAITIGLTRKTSRSKYSTKSIFDWETEPGYWFTSDTEVYSSHRPSAAVLSQLARGVIQVIEAPAVMRDTFCRPPRSVYHLLDSLDTAVKAVLMVFSPEDAAWLSKQGVPVTKLADLPAPPKIQRTYSSSRTKDKDTEEEDTRTKLDKALEACYRPSADFHGYDPHCAKDSITSWSWWSHGREPQLMVDSYSYSVDMVPNMVIIPVSSKSSDGKRTVSPDTCAELLRSLVSTKSLEGRSLDSDWFSLAARAVRDSGYTLVAIHQNKTSYIQELRKAGAKTLAEAVTEVRTRKPQSRKFLRQAVVADVYHNHISSCDAHPCTFEVLSKDTRKRVNKLRRFIAGVPATRSNEEWASLWLNMLYVYDIPGTEHKWSSDGYGIYDLPEVVEAYAICKQAYTELTKAYPVVKELGGCGYSRWNSLVDRIVCSYLWDLPVYLQAMTLWHKQNNKQQQKGSEQ